MNWDRIEGNWNKIKGNVVEQWDDLTEDQLVNRIQETYGIADDEAERELTDWQQRLSEINRAGANGDYHPAAVQSTHFPSRSRRLQRASCQ